MQVGVVQLALDLQHLDQPEHYLFADTTVKKCLHFFKYYALSSLEIVTTAELSSMITAGSNIGISSSEHMCMINSMSLTRVYNARFSA